MDAQGYGFVESIRQYKDKTVFEVNDYSGTNTLVHYLGDNYSIQYIRPGSTIHYRGADMGSNNVQVDDHSGISNATKVYLPARPSRIKEDLAYGKEFVIYDTDGAQHLIDKKSWDNQTQSFTLGNGKTIPMTDIKAFYKPFTCDIYHVTQDGKLLTALVYGEEDHDEQPGRLHRNIYWAVTRYIYENYPKLHALNPRVSDITFIGYNFMKEAHNVSIECSTSDSITCEIYDEIPISAFTI